MCVIVLCCYIAIIDSEMQAKMQTYPADEDVTYLVEEKFHPIIFKSLCQYMDTVLSQESICKFLYLFVCLFLDIIAILFISTYYLLSSICTCVCM